MQATACRGVSDRADFMFGWIDGAGRWNDHGPAALDWPAGDGQIPIKNDLWADYINMDWPVGLLGGTRLRTRSGVSTSRRPGPLGRLGWGTLPEGADGVRNSSVAGEMTDQTDHGFGH